MSDKDTYGYVYIVYYSRSGIYLVCTLMPLRSAFQVCLLMAIWPYFFFKFGRETPCLRDVSEAFQAKTGAFKAVTD